MPQEGLRGYGSRIFAEQTGDGVGRLGTLGHPMGDAVVLQVDLGRLNDGVVGTHDFNGSAIARAFLVDYDNAVGGLLLRAKARQADHQHLILKTSVLN